MTGIEAAEGGARHLADQGMSQRAIAKRLGISRYQVGRILADQSGHAAGPVGHVAGAGSSVADHASAGDRLADHVADRPADEPADHRPVCGAGIFVPLREGLGKDVADLMRTGCTAADAAAFAVSVLASAYRNAVERGTLADGDALDVVAITFRPPDRAATAA